MKKEISLALTAAFASSLTIASTVTINDPATSSGYTVSQYLNPTPSSTELHILGVYETRSDPSFGYHPQGTATVHVKNQGATPFVLVLSSYEPTQWNIDLEAGANLTQIFTNGYYAQPVSGFSGTVTSLSGVCNSGFPYSWSSAQGLSNCVENLTGLKTSSFSGVYRATDFTITTSAVPLPSTATLFSGAIVGLFFRRKRS